MQATAHAAVRRALALGPVAVAGLVVVPASASAGLFPPLFELTTLQAVHGGDGSMGFVLNGITRFDHTGAAVSNAGDVNGDGVDDLLIGAPDADPRAGDNSAGKTFVVFGRVTAQTGNFPADFALSSLLFANGGDGSAGFVLDGIDFHDYSARSVSTAGDLNGDGIDDIVIGAPGADPPGASGGGEIYVVFGRDTTDTGNFPAELELSSLLQANGGNGSAGLVLMGEHDSDAGKSVSNAGDVNGDGIDDLVVGAHGPVNSPGHAFVFFGRNTADAGAFPAEFKLRELLSAHGGDGTAGFVAVGGESNFIGESVSAAGDINGDGLADMVIGARLGGLDGAGRCNIVFGRDTAFGGNFAAEFELASLLAANGGDGSAGFVLYGVEASDQACSPVSDAGDVNGDGIDDLIIESGGGDKVFFGRDTSRDGNFAPEIALASLLGANGGDGSAGFVVHGAESPATEGVSVSAAGDVNGDLIGDMILGSPDMHTSYVLFGRNTVNADPFPAEFDVATLFPDAGGDGSAGFVLHMSDGGQAGGAVSVAGDVNGDGIDDLVIGGHDAKNHDDVDGGTAYVVFGRQDGDTDGDGFSNLLDNCTLVANADQRDTNGDGYGNLCDPDLNDDGFVNFTDLGMLKSVFFSADPDADFDGSGAVNFVDLGTIKSFFFLPPGPSGLANGRSGNRDVPSPHR